MWMTIIGFLGGPVIKGMIDAYREKLKAGSTDKMTAAKAAGEELAVQQMELGSIYQLRIAQIGHPWEPEKIAMYITLLYYGKIIIIDKVFGALFHTKTDDLHSYVAIWAGMIMSFYFAKRGAENVTTIIKAFK